MSTFAVAFSQMQAEVHAIARAKGWWDQPRNGGEAIALMHSELSEALEALRKGNPPDEKLPQFSAVEVEMADLVIRAMDWAQGMGLRLAEAIQAKAEYNQGRAIRHGKQF